ncbi:MAG: hypothetical protein GXP44_02635 [bacterium]|nr:hypothetical protein [bacterium]
MLIYWSLFAILSIDRLFFKKITSLLLWKIVFVAGIIILIIKDASLIPLLMEIQQKGADIWKNLGFSLLINTITLLFIYRSYKFISKGV